MPKQEIGEQHSHPAETQQQQQTQRQTTTIAGTPHPSGYRQETTDEEFEDDETSVLIKRPKDDKKAERTPLLDHNLPERMVASPDAPAALRNERASTFDSQQSDDEIARICSDTGADFTACLVEAIRAINRGVYPERIPQGSSGSYFVMNLQKKKIGVFKPKNEEPYGSLNPKWIKWLHKLFFPCCFGRSCLVPNQGYLSEAGASLVDQKLGLGVVPKTAVISLAAPTFNYNRVKRAMTRTKERIRHRYPGIGRHFRRVGLPPKRGSFQLFVNGYKDASYWLRQWELYPELAPPSATMDEFQLEFERMVVLDYIIRNTDRGNDNWLILYEPADVTEDTQSTEEIAEKSSEGIRRSQSMEALKRLKEELGDQPLKFADDNGKLVDIQDESTLKKLDKASKSRQQSPMHSQVTKQPSTEAPTEHAEAAKTTANGEKNKNSWESVSMPRVKIAAIDNGLAFPFKHPDQWRAYPYRWADLPMAQKPFSDAIIKQVLPLIDNTDFVRDLGNDLRKIFQTDKGFDKKTFSKQLSVIRGQMFNLREALRTKKSPAQLVQMTPQYMIEIKKKKRRKFRKLARTFAGVPRTTVIADENTTVATDASGPTTSSNLTIVTEQPTSGSRPKSQTSPAGQPQPSPIVDIGESSGKNGPSALTADAQQGQHQSQPSGSTSSISPTLAEDRDQAPALTDDEANDPKSWHNVYQQKVQTRAPFFARWGCCCIW